MYLSLSTYHLSIYHQFNYLSIHHIFFIHSSVDGYLRCSHVLAIVNSAAMNSVGFPGASYGKESPCNERDLGSIPGSGRSPGEGNGYPLQYFAWRIPWTGEPGRQKFMGLQRVRHDWQNASVQFREHCGCMHLFRLEFSLDICPGVGLLDHMTILFSVFWGTSILFSIVASPIYFPTNSVVEFCFPHTSPAFVIFRIFLMTF